MMKRSPHICVILLLALAVTFSVTFGASAAGEEKELTVLFTHDTHDHFLPVATEIGGESGGYIRLATLLREQRAEATGAVVTLDAGDFSMGSLFQTIFATHAPELRAMGQMGFDVTTLGNHEFDYRAAGLAGMLQAAVESGTKLPAIVQANYKPPVDDRDSWDAWNEYGITDYVVLEREGVRAAIFGLLGVDADECAPMSGMEFTPIAEAAQRVVEAIRANESADYIICLSHSGTSGGEGEDYELAKAVSGIDLIISGHTHTTLTEPIQVNDTMIVSCGEYTQNLGRVVLAKDNGKTTLTDYDLIPVDEIIDEDEALVSMAEEFKAVVGETYLSGYDMTYDQVLATSAFDFTSVSDFGKEHKADGLGELIADSYVYAVEQAEGKRYVPVDFAVVATGVIRSSFTAGEITVSDAFEVSSLGVGADGTPGYPLISVWLTGKELKDAFEVDASVSPMMSSVQLYASGMEWTFNPNRMIFDKVTGCAQVLPDGSRVEIKDEKLYRVVTGLYSGQMLGTVKEASYGILSIVPKNANGEVIDDFEEHIVYNVSGEEVKEWYALATYLESMGEIPDTYRQGDNKIVEDSRDPVSLLKDPGWPTLLVLTVLLVLVVMAAVAVRCVRRRKRK